MSYDRRAGVRLESVLHKAAEAEEHARSAYLALHSLKAGYDNMEEIPEFLRPSYSQLLKALGPLPDAIQEAHQLSQMVRRLPR